MFFYFKKHTLIVFRVINQPRDVVHILSVEVGRIFHKKKILKTTKHKTLTCTLLKTKYTWSGLVKWKKKTQTCLKKKF